MKIYLFRKIHLNGAESLSFFQKNVHSKKSNDIILAEIEKTIKSYFT